MSDDFDPYWEWLGIPPSGGSMDYYRLLGLERYEARRDLIEQVADERMAIVRKHEMGARAEHTYNILNQLAAARVCLLNPATKATYDAVLQGTSDRIAGGPLMPPPAPPPPPTPVPAPPIAAPLQQAAAPSRHSNQENDDDFDASPSRPMLLIVVSGTLVVAVLGGLVGWGVARSRQSGKKVTSPDVEEVPKTEKVVVEPEEQAIVIMQEATGQVNLSPATALVYDDIQLATFDGDEVLTNWKSQDDWIEWRIKISKPGVFQVNLTYSADEAAATAKCVFIVGDTTKKVDIRDSGGEGNFITDEYFIAIKSGGEHTFRVQAEGEFGDSFIDVRDIRLVPATQ